MTPPPPTTHAPLTLPPPYQGYFSHSVPIESQFIAGLKDNLNAEVVLGTVANVKEASQWLSYTYLFVRMLQNPLAYGVAWEQLAEDPRLERHRQGTPPRQTRTPLAPSLCPLPSDSPRPYYIWPLFSSAQLVSRRPPHTHTPLAAGLIREAARALDRSRMIRFDERSGNMYVTELGRVASHYYLRHASIEAYNELLKPSMSDSEVLACVARSSEFENVAPREDEMLELEALSRSDSCPVDIKVTINDGRLTSD